MRLGATLAPLAAASGAEIRGVVHRRDSGRARRQVAQTRLFAPPPHGGEENAERDDREINVAMRDKKIMAPAFRLDRFLRD